MNENAEKKRPGLDPRIKKLLGDYVAQGIGPRRMLTRLRESGFQPPAKDKINAALRTIRREIARKKQVHQMLLGHY